MIICSIYKLSWYNKHLNCFLVYYQLQLQKIQIHFYQLYYKCFRIHKSKHKWILFQMCKYMDILSSNMENNQR